MSWLITINSKTQIFCQSVVMICIAFLIFGPWALQRIAIQVFVHKTIICKTFFIFHKWLDAMTKTVLENFYTNKLVADSLNFCNVSINARMAVICKHSMAPLLYSYFKYKSKSQIFKLIHLNQCGNLFYTHIL